VYYNLGNAHYRLGEREPDLNAKVADWEESLQHYQSALKLSPADADAKFNRDLVARKLEALKQQQAKSQPKPGGQNKDQQNNDKDRQKQPSDPAQRQPQQGESKPEQKQDQQQAQRDQPDQSQPQPAPKPEPPPQQQAKSGRQDAQPQGAQPQQASPADKEEGKPEDTPEIKAARLGQMTPEQARQLLEAAKAEEKPMIFILPQDLKRRSRSFKDW
jgi:Ca-activated chloride channel family protein